MFIIKDVSAPAPNVRSVNGVIHSAHRELFVRACRQLAMQAKWIKLDLTNIHDYQLNKEGKVCGQSDFSFH